MRLLCSCIEDIEEVHMKSPTHRARDLRHQGALAVLRYVHERPSSSRAEAARALGLSSGSAADITARLKNLDLLAETDALPATGRGRPSPRLGAHPDGPLVCVVDLSHERWQVAGVELGGRIVERHSGRNA